MPDTQAGKAGNFDDFESLFEMLATPAVMELGFPLPKDEFMPRRRVGSCPVAHNRELIGDED